MSRQRRLCDIAKVIRSKNAGPFNLTFDIILRSEAIYRHIKENNLITPEIVADKYGIDRSDVRVFEYVDWIHALKITIKRPWVSGSPGESDVYGCQQHAPLLGIKVDIPDGSS